MSPHRPSARSMTVDALFRRRPAAIRVFLDRRMACVGCPVGRLHTLADACAAHGVALAPLLADIGALTPARRDRRRPRRSGTGGADRRP